MIDSILFQCGVFYFNFLEVSNAKTYVLASNILDGMATPILWVGKFGQLRTMESVASESDFLVLRQLCSFETSCLECRHEDNADNEENEDNFRLCFIIYPILSNISNASDVNDGICAPLGPSFPHSHRRLPYVDHIWARQQGGEDVLICCTTLVLHRSSHLSLQYPGWLHGGIVAVQTVWFAPHLSRQCRWSRCR